MTENNIILQFDQINLNDIAEVGGKNASLGEMIQHLTKEDVLVPPGFAITASAFRKFLTDNQLDKKIYPALAKLDVSHIDQLKKVATEIRQQILKTDFSHQFITIVKKAFQTLVRNDEESFAVRSSATAEDLPEASFAGQQDTYLNVVGFDEILLAIKKVYASLFTERAISYRAHHHFPHDEVAISVGIQRMVRSDRAASGVMFTLDTESGFKDAIFITAAYGLGELVVQGKINPDEFYVSKIALQKSPNAILMRKLGTKAERMILGKNQDEPVAIQPTPADQAERFCISDHDIQQLARDALKIEKHYGRAMDIEWAKDGIDQKIYIVQARPETVKSNAKHQTSERYVLKESGEIVVTGRSVGHKIGHGHAKVAFHLDELSNFTQGDVVVTDMTDPDWEPIMKKASAIVTNRGGRTCHAAIIARELGIPAVVGCIDATKKIKANDPITVSCSEGDEGYIYKNKLAFEVKKISVDSMPPLSIKLMMNVGNPERAFNFSQLPNDGIGLARLEFIINHMIGIHPRACLDFENLKDESLKKAILQKSSAYRNPKEFYIERLKEGISMIAAAFYPKWVIVRLSDFKSNEYANLLGGNIYEPQEENPMIGFRGASRYVSPHFKESFALECVALKRVRDEMGFENVVIMIPFVRSITELKQVITLLKEQGLEREKNNLKIIMMCELPTNALLAEKYLEHVDGFSIGSNDLTQLTLGLDRDSELVASLFDERDEAIKKLLAMAIDACNQQKKYIGICGQGPSDHPDLAAWLIERGIQSISLNPDTVVDTWLYLSKMGG